MIRLKALVYAVLLVLGFSLHGKVYAQDAVWVQIEARPTLQQAEARARDYAARLPNVSGFRLRSGWYAIAIGPILAPLAPGELARLRAAREIPGDSFVADGRNFREQFWPIGAAGVAQPVITAPLGQPSESVALPAPEPADETPAEARASERLLNRADREDIQRALKASGFYSSIIDGSFGRGTRSAMASWQAATGYEATGILTTSQRRILLDTYRDAIASLGLSPVYDADAGIDITLPMARVAFQGYEAPFARYGGLEDDAQILLISQPGDSDTLRGLYDVLQTLEIVPLEGPREFARARFSITGENAKIRTQVEAVLTVDGVKGYAVIWPVEDRLGQELVLEALKSSFSPVEGVVLPDTAGDRSLQRPDLLAGLQIRQPEISASGFFVDFSGRVLTSSETVASCSRITIEGETEADVVAIDAATGLALLQPRAELSPLGVGLLRADPPLLQSEVAVAGYSYGGILGAPTLSFGTLLDLRGLNGEANLSRLALSAEPGDEGGPVLDGAGGVLGILLPPPNAGDRSLPPDVRYAADAVAIAGFLAENGVTLGAPPPNDPLAPEDITAIGSDMTVLVECWG